MAKVIWKFSLGPSIDHTLSMPKGAEVLHADVQVGEFYLWALVDPAEETEDRHFIIAPTGGTGDDRISKATHISTIMDGRFVWHFFEEKQ